MAEENTTVEQNGEQLTEAQVFDVIKFASEYYNSMVDTKYGLTGFTPYLTNERLSQIGLRPKKASKEKLEKQFEDPTGNQKQMVGYSEYLKLTETLSKRTMLYMGNLPSFDYTFVPVNATAEDMRTEAYKKDLAKAREFLYKFDVKGQFGYVARRMLESDAFYSILRTEGDNYVFEELPYDYCLITGRNSDFGFVFDFDMSWFLQQGLSIDQYPRNFRTLWRRVFGDLNSLENYNPGNKLKKRKGTFSTWTQTSPLPQYGAFTCFKFNSDSYATIPFLTSMFSDAVNKPLVRLLQNNQYIIASQKLLVGLIPLLKDQKSGQVADALAIKAGTLAKFLGLLKQGLSDAIKVGGVPFSDLKDISFEQGQKSIYNEYNSNLSKQSGVTGSLIYGSERPTATEITYSAEIDSMIATSIYAPMQTWLSSYINTLTDKYKFKFTFEGTKYGTSRKDRLDNAFKLANAGIVLPQKFAAALGMNIFELQDQIEMGRADDFIEKLYLLPNTNTKSLGGEVGRPTLSVEEASESTLSKLDRE